MKAPDAWHRELAQRLIIGRAGCDPGPGDVATSAASFFEGLDGELANLIGPVGILALQRRAVRLGRREFPILEEVEGEQTGQTLGVGLRTLSDRSDPEQYAAAMVGLAAQMIGLLVSLIGDEITLRLLRKTYPDVELQRPIPERKKATGAGETE